MNYLFKRGWPHRSLGSSGKIPKCYRQQQQKAVGLPRASASYLVIMCWCMLNAFLARIVVAEDIHRLSRAPPQHMVLDGWQLVNDPIWSCLWLIITTSGCEGASCYVDETWLGFWRCDITFVNILKQGTCLMKTAPCWVKIKFNRKPFPRTHSQPAVEMTGESMTRNHETFPRPWQSSSYDYCWDTKTNQM